MNPSLSNKHVIVGVSITCFLFVILIFLNKITLPIALDLNTHTTKETTQAIHLEKTVSPDSIHALFNSLTLTDEQAKIFHASLPRSLSDSPLPSTLDTDEKGQLVINKKVKRLFEFYLSAMGEETLAECIERIRYNLSQQLEADALNTALKLLENFLQYRNHIGHIKNDFLSRYENQSYSLEKVKEMKDRIQNSRSLFFSEKENHAFYKAEDEYDHYMINKIEIRSNQNLTETEKEEKYALLSAHSPSWIIQQEQESNLVSYIQAQEKTLRSSGADANTIEQLRIDNYGEAAAHNLAALDQEREKWSNRVALYRIDSLHILHNANYNQQEKNQLLQDIRLQHFSGSELVRIRALDKIETDKIK